MKRFFKRDDGRVCILSAVWTSTTLDIDRNKDGIAEWKDLSMLCGGKSWLANEVKEPPTCILCIAADRPSVAEIPDEAD